MSLPPLTADGELPSGVHSASLDEVAKVFGPGSRQRQIVTNRLIRIHQLAISSGQLVRFIVFGSFATAKPEPNDVDVMLIMNDDCDQSSMDGQTAILFRHQDAQAYFGASIFWIERSGDVQGMLDFCQSTRSGGKRGIIEIVQETP